MEGFKAYSFTPLPDEQQTKEIGLAVRQAVANTQGEYRKEIFDSLPPLWACKSALVDLNQFMPIQEQFRKNSNKSYYSQGGRFFSLEQAQKAREEILARFWKKELPVQK